MVLGGIRGLESHHSKKGCLCGIIKLQLRGWAKQCGHSHEAGYAELSISDNTLVQAVKPRPPPPLDREFSVGLSAVVFIDK